MVEVQCTSCHTRYRVDEQVLPEGTPTFKCSRCGHVFTIEPRTGEAAEAPPTRTRATPREDRARQESPPEPISPPGTGQSPAPPIVDRPESGNPEHETEPSRASAVAAAPAQTPPPEPTAAPKPTTIKISTAELLSRPFVKAPEEAPEGENLAFDFNDEHPQLDDDAIGDSGPINDDLMHEPPEKIWAVGDDPKPHAAAAGLDRFAIGDSPARGRSRKAPAAEDQFIDEAGAPLYNRGVAHSARFFLGLLLLVFIGFAATTMTIHTAPAAARGFLNELPIIGDRFASPLVPARMIALHDVHANYQSGKDGKSILVIAGQAENVTTHALHTVGIAAVLAASVGKAGARREVYCGNNLVSRTIGEMTSHEIDFFQGLPPPQSFSVDPSASCPFVIVFTGPLLPPSHFALTVSRAEPASEEPVPSGS